MLCYGSVVVEYERRRSGLPNAPLDMENGNNRDHIEIVSHIYFQPPPALPLLVIIHRTSVRTLLDDSGASRVHLNLLSRYLCLNV